MAAHSSVLAWTRTPGTEEPGGLQPMGSKGSITTVSPILPLSVAFRCRRGSEGVGAGGDGGEGWGRGLALGVGLQPHLLTFPPAQVARQEGGHPDLGAAIPQGEDPLAPELPTLPLPRADWMLQAHLSWGVGPSFHPARRLFCLQLRAQVGAEALPGSGLLLKAQQQARRPSSGISTCVCPQTSSAAARWVQRAPGWARGRVCVAQAL